MASIGHVIVGMAAARVFARNESPRYVGAWMIRLGALSLLPDLDVYAFAFDIPYEAAWGHRGATHSPVFALLLSALITIAFSRSAMPRARLLELFVTALLVLGSHGVLDALTDGGKGVAFAWPFGTARYFFPWQPLAVAPIGPAVLGHSGRAVMLREAMVFSPILLLSLVPRTWWPWRKRAR